MKELCCQSKQQIVNQRVNAPCNDPRWNSTVMHYITCKARRCPHTEDHCLPVFPCSRNYPYLLSALPKCSCPFSCSLTSFKLPLFPCSPTEIDHVPLFPTLSYCLGSLDKYDSLRSSWLDYARTTCPLCDLLIFVRASCSEQNDLVFSSANASTNL